MNRKGLIISSINVPSQQGPTNVIINQSNNYCTHQLLGTVAGTRDSEMNSEVLALKELHRKGPRAGMPQRPAWETVGGR